MHIFFTENSQYFNSLIPSIIFLTQKFISFGRAANKRNFLEKNKGSKVLFCICGKQRCDNVSGLKCGLYLY
jgi:hypothetical protein